MTDDAASRSTRGVCGISVAAELSGIGPQTLRNYERWGLRTPSRTDGGTRRYSDDDVQRLSRITELVEQGVNLAGIGRILDLESRNTGLEANNSQIAVGQRQTDGRPTETFERPIETPEVRIMGGVENLGPLDEVPEADAAEQHRDVGSDDAAGLDTAYLSDAASDRDANEADLVDQAFVVPYSDDDRGIDG